MITMKILHENFIELNYFYKNFRGEHSSMTVINYVIEQ